MKRIVVDHTLCSGCRLCEVVCSETHEQEINPGLSRLRIIKVEESGLDKPRICEQCNDAPCAAVCPVQAISFKPETGAWLVDEAACTECGLCVEACPFDAIHLHPLRGIAYKCDNCGADPQCVRVCELGALRWADLKEE